MTSSERWKTFACFVLIHMAALSGSATEIRLKPHVQSRGSVVLLGDIAEVMEEAPEERVAGETGASATTDFLAELARIELFPAPSANHRRTVRQREVRELLGLHGMDPRRLRFTGAHTVTVEAGEATRPSSVASAAHTSVAHAASAAVVASRGSAKPIASVDEPMPEPEPEVELVLAPVRPLRRGEVIRASHVDWIPVPLNGKGSVESLRIEPAVQLDDVVGMAATRSLLANRPLDLRAVERPLVVHKGDLVTVTSQAPGVRVETVARAIDNAAVGDPVVLESILNRKRYTAHVTGHKAAEVYASGIRVSSPPQPLDAARQTPPEAGATP